MQAFIQSQFGYCLLVWMFHSRKLNNRINKIHEKSLRVVYDDKISTFSELLEKDNYFTKGTSRCAHKCTHKPCTHVHTQAMHKCAHTCIHKQCTHVHTQVMHTRAYTSHALMCTYKPCTNVHTQAMHKCVHTSHAHMCIHKPCTLGIEDN